MNEAQRILDALETLVDAEIFRKTVDDRIAVPVGAAAIAEFPRAACAVCNDWWVQLQLRTWRKSVPLLPRSLRLTTNRPSACPPSCSLSECMAGCGASCASSLPCLCRCMPGWAAQCTPIS